MVPIMTFDDLRNKNGLRVKLGLPVADGVDMLPLEMLALQRLDSGSGERVQADGN